MNATPLQTAISSLPSLRSIQSQETELGWSLNLQQGTVPSPTGVV